MNDERLLANDYQLGHKRPSYEVKRASFGKEHCRCSILPLRQIHRFSWVGTYTGPDLQMLNLLVATV